MKRKASMTKHVFTQDLEALVGFETVTGQPNGFNEAMRFISERIRSDAFVEVLPNNGEPILIASNYKTNTPDVCYMVHLDVVSAKPEQFQMQLKGNLAYGRGTSDMKFSIPIGYALLNDLLANKSDLSFMFIVTSDEERGGFKGAGYLADTFGLKPKLLIVPDGGDDFEISNKSKGVCQIEVSMVGRPGHSSRPWDGKSAIAPVVKLAEKLLGIYASANTTDGWHTTMNIGFISGGKLYNQVPPEAKFGIDFRFPPENDTVESLTEFVMKLANEIDPGLKIEVTATGNAGYTDPDDPAMQLLVKILQKKLGRKIVLRGSHGSNDARHFNKNGVPYLMTKPAGGDIHGDNEHIDIDSCMVLYEVFSEFLAQYK